MTFSIVAADVEAQELGVAVASKFLAVGAVVPWAIAGIGAVATQAHANTTYGPLGLKMLQEGYKPEDVIRGLTAADGEKEHRQLGIVAADGSAASFTGGECLDWAGGRTGQGYATQGNILAGSSVIESMALGFEESSGDLASRLLAALAAGQREGGDRRGQQSAALVVVRAGGGYAGSNDRFIDLRVDDHLAPIDELERLTAIHRLYFGRTRDEDIVQVDANLIARVQGMLKRAVAEGATLPETENAMHRLEVLYGVENLEDRWLGPDSLDRTALDYLLEKYDPGPHAVRD